MIAIVLASSSSVSLYLSALGFLVTGFLFTPQAVRKDKRVIVAVLAVLVLVVVGHAIEAGPWVCPWQGTWAEFMCYVP